MENLIGKNIGRYHILEKLGEGGMAVVYKAFDTRLEREVAVKFIRIERIIPQDLKQMLLRFEREAKALARFHHPNIVTIFDFGEYEDSPYLIMEYLPGDTLKKLAGKPLNWQQAFKILIPIAQALAYAHKREVLHRDVKPGNILFDENGHPKLADFGIAMVLESDDSAPITLTGTGVGTPDYMSPEQCLGNPASERSDIYALAIVLYELITGRRPYRADTPMAVLVKQINDPLPRPRDLNPAIPQEVENILIKALAKNAADRYGDMQEFSIALQALLDKGEMQALQAEPFASEAAMQAAEPLVSDQTLVDEITRVEAVTARPSLKDEATLVENSPQQRLTDMATRVDVVHPKQVPIKQSSKKQSRVPVGLWIGLAVLVITGLGVGGYLLSQKQPAVPAATQIPVVVQSQATEMPPTELPQDPAAVGQEPVTQPEPVAKICMVTDTGGIDDQTYNATTWQGVEMAKSEFGIEAVFLESREADDFEKNLNEFIEQNCSLIISAGFSLGDATLESARNHPDLRYSIVDFSYDPQEHNILSQTFLVDEAAFLAGYLAAGMTQSDKVGTFGGLPIPSVTLFMDGFAKGVNYFNDLKGRQVQVLGWDLNNPDGGLFTMNFDDQDAGKDMAIAFLDEGVDIIFPVAGPVGLGCASAIQERGNGLLIGVDSDWAVLNPQYENIILTSVLKRMERTTFFVIQSVLEDSFSGGEMYGNLENGGVDLAPFHMLEDRVPPELREELQIIRERIMTGEITLR